MKKILIIRYLPVLALILLIGRIAMADDGDKSVTEAFRELQSALQNDPNISPDVRQALENFGKAVSKMENKSSGGAVASEDLGKKIDQWFNNKKRLSKLDGFFGTSGKKGLLERLKVYGDFRFRLEATSNSGSSAHGDPNNRARTRYRARFRLGGEYEVAPNTWIGARLVTGSQSDAQSAHQTFDHNFQKWDVNLDRVYLHWAPFKSKPLSLGGDMKFTTDLWLGKFSHGKTFMHTGFMWDGDVQPEGIAMHNVIKGLGFIDELQLNLAGYVLTENKDQQDASMAVMQLVLKKKFNLGLAAPLEMTFATGFYDINDTDTNSDGSMIISRGVSHSPTLVSRDGMVFQSHYEIWDNILEFKYKGIEFLGKKRPLKVTFNYIYNTHAADDKAHSAGKQNKAYAVMATFGEAKKRGDWRIGAAYAHIERDAVYAPVTTDDFAVIGNMKGGWIFVDYALWDKTVLRLWGLWDNPIDGQPDDSQDDHFRFRLQLDVKF